MKVSGRIYRALLKAYPAEYLRCYGEPMEQMFSDQLNAASGFGAVLRLWLRTVADLLRTVPGQHLERLFPKSRFAGYNQASLRSVFYAQYTATRSGHAGITAEDLLAGVLREERAMGEWFSQEGLDQIARLIGTPQNSRRRIFRARPVSMSSVSTDILALASKEAERASVEGVTPRHLLAGIVRQGQTTAADLLRQNGIDLERLRS